MKKPTWQPGGGGGRLIVAPPTIRDAPEGAEYVFSVWMERPGGAAFLLHTVSFAVNVPLETPADPGTAALMACVLPAMRMGLPLHVDAPVSPRYLEAVEEYVDIFSTWVDKFQRVRIHAPRADVHPIPRHADRRGVGSFFSLGVDGFYTYRRHAAEITDLIFIHGFDVDVEKHGHRHAVQTAVETAAGELGKRLITVQTNVRSFSDDYLWWGHQCGSVLGATGQLLAGQLRRNYIAASSGINDIVIYGSSAMSDPLFSTERIEVIHDATHDRVDKVAALAQDDFVLRHLRVCWGQEGSARNCGSCSKCVRTMTGLFLAGALDRAETFPREVDVATVRAMRVHHAHFGFIREILDRARDLGLESTPVIQAWKECALRSGWGGGGDPEETLNGPLLDTLGKEERDLLFADLRAHAPDALCAEAGKHAGRMREEAFEFLWRNHRSALWRAMRTGEVK